MKFQTSNALRDVLHTFRRSFYPALSLLYPRPCPGCDRVLAMTGSKAQTFYLKDRQSEIYKERTLNPYICKVCYAALSFPSGNRCLRCSRPLLDPVGAFCPDCQSQRHAFDFGTALLMHDALSRKILYGLKYENRRENADFLSLEAVKRLKDFFQFAAAEVMIPVPLHPRRYRQRGYNQAEVLARKISFYLKDIGIHIPVDSRYLLRVKHTEAQKELSREARKQNLEESFAVSYKEAYGKYKRVLLVDDIYTSGVTLSACAAVLKQAGAEKVLFFTGSIG